MLLPLSLLCFLSPSSQAPGDRCSDYTGTNISKLSQFLCAWVWHTAKPTNCSPVFLMLKYSKQARRNKIWRWGYAKP